MRGEAKRITILEKMLFLFISIKDLQLGLMYFLEEQYIKHVRTSTGNLSEAKTKFQPLQLQNVEIVEKILIFWMLMVIIIDISVLVATGDSGD